MKEREWFPLVTDRHTIWYRVKGDSGRWGKRKQIIGGLSYFIFNVMDSHWKVKSRGNCVCYDQTYNFKRWFCLECRKGARAPVLVQMQNVCYLDLTSDSGNKEKSINQGMLII